jgi:hypothetical protein
MSKSLYMRRDGSVSGPFSNKEIFAMARAGDLLPTDELSRSESGPWRPAEQVGGLAAILAGEVHGAAGVPSEGGAGEGEASDETRGSAADVPLSERPFDVFVSHSNKDKKTADALVHVLEERGTRCWIAPRDITPGASWAGSIMEAITQCRVFVLILSRNSNTSVQVLQEIERAVNRGLTVVPMRIEDVPPSQDLELFLGMRHWLDAFGGSQPEQLQECATAIQGILGVQQSATPAAAPQPSPAEPQTRSRMPLMAAGAVGVLALGALATQFLGGDPSSEPGGTPQGEVHGSEVSEEDPGESGSAALTAQETQVVQAPDPVPLRPSEIAVQLQSWLPNGRALDFTSQSPGGWGGQLVGLVDYDVSANALELSLQSVQDASKYARFRANLEERQVNEERVVFTAVDVADREQRLRLAGGSEIVLAKAQSEIELSAGSYSARGEVDDSSAWPEQAALSSAANRVFEGLWVSDGRPTRVQACLLQRPGAQRWDLVVTHGDTNAVAFGSFDDEDGTKGWGKRFQRSSESPQNDLVGAPFSGRSGALSARLLDDGRLALGWSKGGVVLEATGATHPGLDALVQGVTSSSTWVGTLRNRALVEEVELRFVQEPDSAGGLIALVRTPDERSGLRLLRGTYDADSDQFASWPIFLEGRDDKSTLKGGTDAAFFHDRGAWLRLRITSEGRLVGRASSGAEFQFQAAVDSDSSAVLGDARQGKLAEVFGTGNRFQGRFRTGAESLEVSVEVVSLNLGRGILELSLAPVERPSDVVVAKGAIDFSAEDTLLWSATLLRESGRVADLGRFEFFSLKNPKSLSLRLMDDGTLFGVHLYETLVLEPLGRPSTENVAQPEAPALPEPSARFFELLGASDSALAKSKWTTASSNAGAAGRELTEEQDPFQSLVDSRRVESRYLERLNSIGNSQEVLVRKWIDLGEEVLEAVDEAVEADPDLDPRIKAARARVLYFEVATCKHLVGTVWKAVQRDSSGSLESRFKKSFSLNDLNSRITRSTAALKRDYPREGIDETGKSWLDWLDD